MVEVKCFDHGLHVRNIVPYESKVFSDVRGDTVFAGFGIYDPADAVQQKDISGSTGSRTMEMEM